jgi:hypothetical protein
MEATATATFSTTPAPRKTEFVPHRDDPLLSMSEAGRLIGKSRTTIARLMDDEMLCSVKDARGLRRVRKSELIRFFGVTAFARKSPYLWVQESELPEDYQYQESYPRIRKMDTITYYPVPLPVEQNG